MAIPTKKDYDSWNKILAKHAKSLDEEGKPKRPMDENLAKALFRDAVRKKWMHSPQKLHFLESQRKPDLDPNSRRKWYRECSKCGDKFNIGAECLDVDHIIPQLPFEDWDQAWEHASGILDKGKADFQLLCNDRTRNDCHLIKSTADRRGLDWTKDGDWEIAKKEVAFNKLMRLTLPKAGDQKKWLSERGVEAGSNLEIRKEQIRKLFEEIKST